MFAPISVNVFTRPSSHARSGSAKRRASDNQFWSTIQAEPAPGPTGRWRRNLFGVTTRHFSPPSRAEAEHKSRKSAENGFLFDRHSVLLRHSARRMILRVNQRNYPRETELIESVIAHRSRGLSRNAPVPIRRIEPVTDFEFFDIIHDLGKKPAVANEPVIFAKDHRELRRQSRASAAD